MLETGSEERCECSSQGTKRIEVYDTTLRDGEQTLGVSFSAQEKLEIAKILEGLGVDYIEAGMPIVSNEDMEAVKAIVKEVKRAKVVGFCRSKIDDVEACLESGVKSVTCEMPVSKIKHETYGYSPAQVEQMLTSTIKFAKDNHLEVSFFAVDATRADLKDLEFYYKKAVDCGADSVVLVDTIGIAHPSMMAQLTKKVLEWVDVPVFIHCHNDLGLATACTLTSVEAGANAVQVTVNGLGERTGNADVFEVALALKMLLNIETGLCWDKFLEASRRIAEISKVPIGYQKPVVGESVFARESGIAVAQLLINPLAVEPFDPKLVGRERSVVLSKKSGKGSLKYVLNEMGLTLPEDKLDTLLLKVKNLGVQKKGVVTREEFKVLLQDAQKG